MSNLLEQASLVMIPSGYKEDIVYSVIPTSGAGDLTFTRASNGTRIDSNGNVEVVPWNFIQYSNAFSTSPWVNARATLTSGQTDPNGGSNAWKVELAGGGTAYLGQFGIGQIGVVTISAYFRADSSTTIGFNDGSSFSNSITIGTTWQRYEFSYTVTSGQCNMQIDNYFGVSPSGQAKTFYIYGAQLNIGSTAKPYFPTTDRLNVPRLTYQNGGGGCPSLLLEKQSTNYLIYNTQIDNLAWVKARSTVTANATTSPDGTQNADAVFVNSDTNTNHEVFQYGTGATEGWSAFFKANGYDFVYMFGSADPVIWFDLQNGVIGTQQSGVNGKITNYGNGWYRCEYYKNSGTNSIWGFGIVPSNGVTTIASPNTSKGVYFWGAQAEAGLYATSMIYTTSSSATRVADACYKTGISSLIGQSEGTMFVDWNFENKPDSNGSIPMVLSGVLGEAYIFVTGGGTLLGEVYNLGLQASISGSIGGIGRKKIALAYKQNDFALYMNGTQIGTDTSGTVSAMSTLYVGSYYVSSYAANSGINEAILFPTRLTNAELASLTTL